jgi:PAS domain S-box-containing protein
MPWVDNLSHRQDLLNCIRGLIALSTMPAIWKSYQPQQIADSIAAALLSMLGAEFVYVALPGAGHYPSVEITRATGRMTASSVSAVEAILRSAPPGRSEQTISITTPAGEDALRCVSAPIGFDGNAALVAGSLRPEFPSETQRLLLGIAANDTTIALQRWQAETEERRFSTIIERSSEFIGFATMDGVPQYINPAGRTLIGFSDSEAISRVGIFDILADHDRRRARDSLLPIVLRTGRWVGELDFRHLRTGEIIPFLVDWFRIDDPRTGRPMNLATVSRDLRNQKKLEFDLRQLNESLEQRVIEKTIELACSNTLLRKEIAERERADARAKTLQLDLLHASRLSAVGQLAGAFAHEINQPLTALTNSVNAARRTLADGPANKLDTSREIMKEAAEQALRAGRIIGRLREFVTRGETEMRFESLPVLIRDATDFALVNAGGRGGQVHLRFDPGAEGVLANRIQVQQLLVNLLRNANEAMASSEQYELVVSTALLDDETIEITVADRGPGLPNEIASHLFEAFRSTKREGMGLGLSICRSIAEAHGGKLRYQPNPGGGTIFRFTLPAVPKNGPINGC